MKGEIFMIEKVISNWKKAQDAGVYLPCPRCGKLCMDEEVQHEMH